MIRRRIKINLPHARGVICNRGAGGSGIIHRLQWQPSFLLWKAKDLSTFAPGELVEIYGTNLAKVTTDWGGLARQFATGSAQRCASRCVGWAKRLFFHVSPGRKWMPCCPSRTPTGSQVLQPTMAMSRALRLTRMWREFAPAVYNFAFK